MSWKKQNTWAVGGLREIGFSNNSDLLIVLSGNGRGIFDCIKAEKIDRDYNDYYTDYWNATNGIIEGFGVLKGQKIICGGFEAPSPLQVSTPDGWQINIENEVRPDWKNRDEPAQVLYLKHPTRSKKIEMCVYHYGINRAYGFSETGNSFVIAESGDLHIWNRQAL